MFRTISRINFRPNNLRLFSESTNGQKQIIINLKKPQIFKNIKNSDFFQNYKYYFQYCVSDIESFTNFIKNKNIDNNVIINNYNDICNYFVGGLSLLGFGTGSYFYYDNCKIEKDHVCEYKYS